MTNKLKVLNPEVEIKVYYAVDFEQNYRNFDFNKLQEFVKWQPDLVIMRISENINLNQLNAYEGKYDEFIMKVNPEGNAKVICSTSFWTASIEATYRIRNIALKRGYKIAELEPLTKNSIYTATGLFSNKGVSEHPGDMGMKAIADIISNEF